MAMLAEEGELYFDLHTKGQRLLTPKNVDVWVSIASAEDACEDYGLSYAF